jgi:hypothetical protein
MPVVPNLCFFARRDDFETQKNVGKNACATVLLIRSDYKAVIVFKARI